MGVPNIPIIVWRCVEEVERRGLDIIGKYRANNRKHFEVESVRVRVLYKNCFMQQVCIDSAVRRPKRGYLEKLSRGTHDPWICRLTMCRTSTSSLVTCRKMHKIIPRKTRGDWSWLRSFFSGVLKDYLRELPEPLFTKCLYQMMVDALAVCLPDDPQGNAKLMFSILDCLPKVNRVRIRKVVFKCNEKKLNTILFFVIIFRF